MRPEPLDRLRGLLAATAGATTSAAVGGRPIALGWATVEIERAATELGANLAIDAERFAVAPDSSLLGARCRVAHEVLLDGLSIVLLEPATEGRLAATLARHGEGPAAVWLAVVNLDAAAAMARVAVPGVSAGRDGPFGVERLIVDGPTAGTHRLLVERAGTIRA